MARHLKLPIHEVLDDIVESLKQHPNLVLQADTGAGKTTAVPLGLLEADVVTGKIVVLQPRRVAAVAAARHMSRMYGESVGETIGYRVRHDNCVGNKTKIEVMTAGILTRIFRTSTKLEGIGCVILDEFHERAADLDICFALCCGLQSQHCPELRIVVMSATLAALGEKLCHRLGSCPRIFHQQRAHQIEVKNIKWQRTGEAQSLEKHVATVVRNVLQDAAGDILVFLPSRTEIWTVLAMLNNLHGIGDGRIPRGFPPGMKLRAPVSDDPQKAIPVLPLHGLLTPEEQDEILRPPQHGHRVILATSIAESSVTIPGVNVVVDSGKRQIRQFFLKSCTHTLRTVEISSASAEQRAGRAGRTGPGVCYRLLEDGETRWDENEQPEIIREDLCGSVLDLITVGVCTDDEIASLPWLDAPAADAVHQSRELLARVRAVQVSPEQGRLLPRGKDLGRLPVHPRLAHVVLQAFMLWGRGGAREACDFVALLQEKEVIEGGRLLHGADLQPRYLAIRHDSTLNVNEFVRKRLRRVSGQLAALIGLEADTGEEREPLDPQCTALMVMWAYPELAAKRVKDWVEKASGPCAGFRLANGAEVYIDANDPLSASPWLAVAELRRDRVSWACAAEAEYLAECGVDVRDPVRHEVFAGDMSRALRDRFRPNPPFMEAMLVDPNEVRVDPVTGKKTTFGALRIQAADEGVIEMKHFWHWDCVLPGQVGAGQRRRDPADGRALTVGEFLEEALGNGRFGDVNEAERYWNETCELLERRRRRPEREDVLPAKGKGKGKGKAKPAAEDARSAAGDDVASVIDGSIADTLDTASIAESTVASSVTEGGRKKVKKDAPPRKMWPMWPTRVLQNQVDAGIEEWLHSIDGRGALSEYQIPIADAFDSTTQILDLYTRQYEDGPKEWVGAEFFEDIGIVKIGHKKLFSKWFNDSLNLIEVHEAPEASEAFAEKPGTAEPPKPSMRSSYKTSLASIAEDDEALRAAEDYMEEWA